MTDSTRAPWYPHAHEACPEFWLRGWRSTCYHCGLRIQRAFPWIATWRHIARSRVHD